ncbi:hypothetical protein P6144_18750 [Sphingomonas sp. HITSZ_GF]|uniref:hypothetical protein n=1 Tax=Sphingomonas sp. HITSZ_GF TaxID=3037247 RepID=UPI00240D4D96|nr:hypothetical protein [Sphingomonas sp. HITSZ_GF]MDG2535707.1 hypothetical protein [Sphingomonas sp. HITSZ_GF]
MSKSIIERGLELANSGAYRRVEEIEREVSFEGYLNASQYFAAPSFRKQLRGLMQSARISRGA